MIECRLRPMSTVNGDEERYGRYHRSNFWDIEGFGKNRWVVGVYIEADYGKLLERYEESEIVERCLEYLNAPPPRKEYQKKTTTPLYGHLSVYQYSFLRPPNGAVCISALLVTTERTNKNFWGKGVREMP